MHLNWWAWQGINDKAQARLRHGLMCDLQDFDMHGRPAQWWRQTHRELLELKACCGKSQRQKEEVYGSIE